MLPKTNVGVIIVSALLCGMVSQILGYAVTYKGCTTTLPRGLTRQDLIDQVYTSHTHWQENGGCTHCDMYNDLNWCICEGRCRREYHYIDRKTGTVLYKYGVYDSLFPGGAPKLIAL